MPSPEVRACVWTGPLRNNLTLDTTKTEISRCQDVLRERELEHQRTVDIAAAEFLFEWIVGVFAGIGLLVLTIRFRAKIAACLYNSFVGCLALRLRFSRVCKRFLDNAIKEAENRLG
jgi:hypothetical protein